MQRRLTHYRQALPVTMRRKILEGGEGRAIQRVCEIILFHRGEVHSIINLKTSRERAEG